MFYPQIYTEDVATILKMMQESGYKMEEEPGPEEEEEEPEPKEEEKQESNPLQPVRIRFDTI